jgi:hypothetical protein
MPDSVAHAQAKQAVLKILKDPKSAEFGTAYRRHGRLPNIYADPYDVVCVEVNAKNSYGGYVGMQMFAYGLNNGQVFDRDLVTVWKMC